MQIELTEKQVELLTDLVNEFLEGFDEATEQVKTDRIHETPEELLTSIEGMFELFDLATTTLVQLRRARGSTTSNV